MMVRLADTDRQLPSAARDQCLLAAEQASSRAASVMSAHTAEQIISIVTVQTAAGRPAAVAVGPEALRRLAGSSSCGRPGVAFSRTWCTGDPRRCTFRTTVLHGP